MSRIVAIVCLLALWISCSPHAVTNNPAPPVDLPSEYLGKSDGKLPEQWWEPFNSKQLNTLIDKVLAQNFDMQIGWNRFRQAALVIKPAKYAWLPEVGLDTRAQKQKVRFVLPEPVGEVFPTVTTYGVSAGASFEVDIWKRLANQLPQRRLESKAARNGISTMAISLAAETAETWFDWIALHAQEDLLNKQLELNETYLKLVELRLDRGMPRVSALDVYQQKQQVVALRAQVTKLNEAKMQIRSKMGILLGKPPSAVKLDPPRVLPEPPPTPGIGVPMQLLHRRPDLKSAMQLVEAADYETAVAVANMYPRIDLSASGSYQATSIPELFTTPLWNLLGGITAPIFQRGVLRAKANRQKEVVQERLLEYGKKLVTAIAEVEMALASIETQDKYLSQVKERLELLTNMVKSSRFRYENGQVDYLAVLTALQAQQQAEIEVLSARRQRLSNYIQLCRALGGTWPGQLPPAEQVELKSLKDKK